MKDLFVLNGDIKDNYLFYFIIYFKSVETHLGVP